MRDRIYGTTVKAHPISPDITHAKLAPNRRHGIHQADYHPGLQEVRASVLGCERMADS
jgi:hypothetical protein